jgi:hypothetical protein
VALVGVCRVASIAPVACLQDDESKPPQRRKPLKFMGFFSVENLPLCLHHTLQIRIRDCGEPEIFRNAPSTFHQKTKKPLNDLEQNQLIENCIMSIILLHSFKQTLPSTS